MSRQRRRSQPKPDAALVQKLDALTTQMAELTRRMSPADAARGTPLPAHLVNPPRQQRTPQLDQVAVKGDAAMGVPSQQLMNDMLKNQAPQAGAVGIYAPGAPLQVVPGIESPYGPRIWDFPYGYNIAALPRSTEATAFQELRDLSDLYYGIRLCQRVWFDVINRLELKISFEPGVIPDGESETDAKWKKLTQPVRDFLAYPDGQNSLSDWLIMSVSDVQELGQSIIFKNRNKKGEIIALDVVDAALVKPLLDQRGRLPKPPYPAFEQFIKGIPAGLYVGDTDVTQEWTSSQMHLIREMARTNSVYSRSRVEDILLIINQALRKQNLDLTRYTDGSTPEGMVFVDPSYAEGSPEEWGEVERSLNGVYAGNDRMRARLKIMPPGLKDYTNTRSPDPQIDFDMWLLKITCGSFGVTMAEIGITDDVNRSTGDSQENVIYRRVVQPLAVRYAQFLTEVVKERFDKRMRVEWGGIEEQEDRLAKAQELDILVKNGSISPSRAAREMGYEVDTEVPAFVLFNGGPTAAIVMDDLDALRKSQLESFQTQTEQAKAGLKNTQLQAEQLQMVIKQQQQGGQQQGEDQGDAGQGQGEGNEPEPNGPGGNSDSGNEQQGEQESEGEASPEDEGEPGGNEDQDQGASEQPGESEGEETGPDDEAAREVDRLIAQAKARQSKGKQQRMHVADDVTAVSDEWRRYRDVALRAVKRQQSVPTFTSDVMPSNLHTYAAEALQRATTPDDVRQVFADVRDAETHPSECRCMVCGCGEPLNDHGKPYITAGTAGNVPGDAPVYPNLMPPVDECFVALFVPAHVGQPLADLVGWENCDPKDLYVSLASLGHETDIDDVDILCATVQAWAKTQHSIVARITGYGRAPDDIGDAVYAVVQSDALPAVRQDLLGALHAALNGAGLPVVDDPGYSPRIVLAHLDPASPMPETIAHVPTNGDAFALSYVWVVSGQYRWAYPLGGDDGERVTVVDELRSLRAEIQRAITAEMTPQHVRWAEHEIVRGTGGKIIGNIYAGVFHPADGVTHEHVRQALALHEASSEKHQALAAYLSRQELSGRLSAAIHREVEARSESAISVMRPGRGASDRQWAEYNAWKAAKESYEEAQAQAQPLKDAMAALLNRDAQAKGVTLRVESPGVFENLLAIWPHLPSGGDIAALLHAQKGDTVTLGTSGKITLQGSHEAYGFIRRRHDNGLIEFSAPTVRVARGERSAASGRDIVRTFAHMQYMGIQRLTAQAERGQDWNGYYTWARIGFVGDIPEPVRAAAQDRFGKNVTRVEQIMALPGGAKWWKNNGVTWDAAFDFTDGSLSRQVFDRLVKSLEGSD